MRTALQQRSLLLPAVKEGCALRFMRKKTPGLQQRRRRWARRGTRRSAITHQLRIASNSKSMLISSPTAGSAKLTPKSERVILVVASKPHTNFSFLGSIGLIAQFMRRTSSRTGLVTPANVRLPSTTAVLSGLMVTLVDL